MPNMRPDELDALTASIKRFGMIHPVTVDQHGEIIDGHNRTAVATMLGINPPRETKTCTPEERDALRVSLNVARRHIPRKQWEEMVDYLRQQGKSVRAIAAATGTPKSKVQRYQSPHSAPVPSGTGAKPVKRTGLDGKQYAAPGQPTERDRILSVLRQNHPKYYSATELGVLGIPTGGVSSRLAKLVQEGLVRRKGARGTYQFQYVPETERQQAPPRPDPKDIKLKRALDEYADIVPDLKDLTDLTRLQRQTKAALESFAQEDERRALQEEKEQKKLLDAQIDLALSGPHLWHALTLKLDRMSKEVGQYAKEFEGLPYPDRFHLRMLGTSMDNLHSLLAALEKKLHPGGTNSVARGSIIDIDP
jgi:hypothetical protein